MAEQILNVQEEVRLKLEKFNVRYKAASDKKRRENVFEEGDMIMVYLRKERIPAGFYKQVESKEVRAVQNCKDDQ